MYRIILLALMAVSACRSTEEKVQPQEPTKLIESEVLRYDGDLIVKRPTGALLTVGHYFELKNAGDTCEVMMVGFTNETVIGAPKNCSWIDNVQPGMKVYFK